MAQDRPRNRGKTNIKQSWNANLVNDKAPINMHLAIDLHRGGIAGSK